MKNTGPDAASSIADPAPGTGDARRLFLLGFLTLFLELALIRYLAGNIWNLGFFPNLVLLGVFVGMGVGFVFQGALPERRSPLAFELAAVTLLVLGVFVHVLRPTVPGFGSWGGTVGGEVYYSAGPKSAGTASVFSFFVWFLAIVAIFALVSQRTAKLFRRFAPLRAYTLDISGSCCGILAFMGVSALQLPAWSWFAALALPVGLVHGRRAWRVAVPLLLFAGLAHHEDQQLLSDPSPQPAFAVRWSPYQKVEVTGSGGNTQIFVNGIGHQGTLRPEEIATSFYSLPYGYRASHRDLPPYRSVLVIGAGSGNDVAAALANGATAVDAVEIDPAIARFGRERHPAQPYSDPRVSLHVTDGRAFMTRATKRYDLIVFALTDSLVKVSPMSQLRLENYLFTADSLRRAYALLSETGDVVLYNYYRVPWIVEKNEAMVEAATGRPPRLLYAEGDFVMLMAGRVTAGNRGAVAAGLDIPTDDWPFPYLRSRGIPAVYLRAGGIVVLLVLLLGVLVHGSGGAETRGRLAGKLAFLFMGTAFLLLETKGVIQFSLLFGTTWLNNSLVFLAVLLLVLVANWTAQGIRDRRMLLAAYLLLVAFSLATLAYPLAGLLGVPNPFVRFVLASLLTFSPIFFANLIFSVSLRDQPMPEHVFGWNLIGASLGGVLEYAGMAVGYNALAVVVAACYTLVIVLLLVDRRAGQSVST